MCEVEKAQRSIIYTMFCVRKTENYIYIHLVLPKEIQGGLKQKQTAVKTKSNLGWGGCG